MAGTRRFDLDEIAKSITVEQLAQALGTEKVQGGWRCPMSERHRRGDKNRSFSIWRAGDGVVMAKCHGCGLSGPPVKVLSEGRGISMPQAAAELAVLAGVHPLEKGATSSSKAKTPHGAGNLKATYQYCRSDGTVAFEKMRYEPKRFCQRQPGQQPGSYSLDGLPDSDKHLIYRLPELQDSEGSILIVEGERDAETALRIGAVATCNSGGAGKWTSDHTAQLPKGRLVVIVPDPDEPGRRHADQVHESCRRAGYDVRLLDLDADLSDWASGRWDEGLRESEIAEELKGLVAGAPMYPAGELSVAESPRETVQRWLDDEDRASAETILNTLAALPPLEYEELRADVAKAAGWRLEVLDTAVKVERELIAEHARTPKPEDPTSLYEQGRAVLEAEDQFVLFRERLRARGFAGDTSAAELVHTALNSRCLERPVNTSIFGASGSGKTFVVESALGFHPSTAARYLTGVSDRAVVFSDFDTKHAYVIVAEAAALAKDGIGASLIRGLAWGEGVAYEITERNEDGQFGTRVINRPGPTGLITTTTRTLDPEISTRMLSIHITDSVEQTTSIVREIAGRATLGATKTVDVADFVAASSWLREAGCSNVSVPYASVLADAVPKDAVRMRRDFTQLITVIKTIAFMHQANRERTEDGKAVVATMDDYALAYRMMAKVMAATVDDVSDAVRETVAAVIELNADKTTKGVSNKELAAHLGLGTSATSTRSITARKAGYLANDENRLGYPVKLVLGEPLPEKRSVLPTTQELRARVVSSLEITSVTEPSESDGSPDASSETLASTGFEGIRVPIREGAGATGRSKASDGVPDGSKATDSKGLRRPIRRSVDNAGDDSDIEPVSTPREPLDIIFEEPDESRDQPG